MRTILLLLIMTAALSGRAQVAEYLVICENDQLEVVSSTEIGKYPNAVILKDKLPSKSAARGWMDANYSGRNCGANTGPAVVPSTPPPATPGTSAELPPPPPEKNITHMYGNTVKFFGNYLFSNIEQVPYFVVTNTKAFQAGFSFMKGNKALFGFEASFQSWGKVFDTDDAKSKFYAAASASFIFSYPVALDKKGEFWFVPEAGVGVDFPNILQAEPSVLVTDDHKVAVPSFFLRVGFEAYHVRPYFYYGRTMISIYGNRDFKGNNIGLGAAVTF